MNDADLHEHVNQALSGFMSNVEVRLRDKLSVLLPALDLLEKKLGDYTDETIAQYLGEARKSAFSILRMASNMGEYARYLRNYEQGEPSRTNLSELMSTLLEEVALLARYKPMSFRFECSEKPFMASVDPGQMERLIYHLLSNAVLYGKGEIVAELKRADGNVIISVKNKNGIISEDTLSVLYVGYKEYVNTKASNLGLGLPIALAIACQNGGTLVVSSDENNGTEVTVSLPDHDTDDEAIELENLLTSRFGGYIKSLIAMSDFPGYNAAYNRVNEKDGTKSCTTSLP